MSKDQHRTVLVICANCGKEHSSRVRNDHKTTRKYCSRECYRQHVKSDPRAVGNWKGGVTKESGYTMIYVGDRDGNGHPHVREHILIAEKVLGRRLKAIRRGDSENEVVHHWNGDKSDNRHSNLLICTQSFHEWLHHRMCFLYQQEHFPPKPETT